MIQRLRQRHRNLFVILAVILPALFLAALATRSSAPRTQEIPLFLVNETPAFPRVLLEKDSLWAGHDLLTRVCADQMPPQRLVVELQPRHTFSKPDILVYWHEPAAVSGNQLPENAYLLGALAGTQLRRFVLPEAARLVEGKLVLYSLAHHQIVATTMLPTSSLLSSGSVK